MILFLLLSCLGAFRANSATNALEEKLHARSFILMGTRIELEVSDASLIEKTQSLVRQLENDWSTWKSNSKLSLLNRLLYRAFVKDAKAATEALKLLALDIEIFLESDFAKRWSESEKIQFDRPFLTNLQRVLEAKEVWRGHFDPGLGSLIRKNRIGDTNKDPVPDPNVFQFEEGGFGKGLALEEVLKLWNDSKAHGFIDFGGQFLYVPQVEKNGKNKEIFTFLKIATGEKSREENPESKVTLQLPAERAWSVAVSSQVENPGHLLNPMTGKSIQPKYLVAANVSASPFWADVGSTGAFVVGLEMNKKWPEDARRGEWLFVYKDRIEASCFYKDYVLTSLKKNFHCKKSKEKRRTKK